MLVIIVCLVTIEGIVKTYLVSNNSVAPVTAQVLFPHRGAIESDVTN